MRLGFLTKIHSNKKGYSQEFPGLVNFWHTVGGQIFLIDSEQAGASMVLCTSGVQAFLFLCTSSVLAHLKCPST